MALISIECRDCPRTIQTNRRNTKYCGVCRLIRDIPFVVGRLYNCQLCDAEYAPLGIRDLVCGDCAPVTQAAGDAQCAFCGETKPRVKAEVAVCHNCARDPRNRKRFWAALKKKQHMEAA